MYVAVCSFEPVDPPWTFSGMSKSYLVDAILLNLQAAGKPGARKVTADDFNALSVTELERVTARIQKYEATGVMEFDKISSAVASAVGHDSSTTPLVQAPET